MGQGVFMAISAWAATNTGQIQSVYLPLFIWSWSFRGTKADLYFMKLLKKANPITYLDVHIISCNFSLSNFVILIYMLYSHRSILSSLILTWKPVESVSLIALAFSKTAMTIVYDWLKFWLLSLVWMFSWQYLCPKNLSEADYHL